MQAIITRYLPPTDARPARIKAQCERGALTVSWDYDLTTDGNHRNACNALCARFVAEDRAKWGAGPGVTHWDRPRVGGPIPSGEFYVFCVVEPELASTPAAAPSRKTARLMPSSFRFFSFLR